MGLKKAPNEQKVQGKIGKIQTNQLGTYLMTWTELSDGASSEMKAPKAAIAGERKKTQSDYTEPKRKTPPSDKRGFVQGPKPSIDPARNALRDAMWILPPWNRSGGTRGSFTNKGHQKLSCTGVWKNGGKIRKSGYAQLMLTKIIRRSAH